MMSMVAPITLMDALQRLTYTDLAYMKLPIQQGFNWAESLADVPSGAWYLVVFRSTHRADSDEALLTDLDERAQVAAHQSPGFLHYFMGTPNAQRECLSFCLWEGQPQAQSASRHEAHQNAQQVAATMYENFHLERYIVRKTPGVDQPIFHQL